MPAVKDKADAIPYDRRLARKYLDDAVAAARKKTAFARGRAGPGDRMLVARRVAEAAEARAGREARRIVARASGREGVAPALGARERALLGGVLRRQIAAATLSASRALLPGGTPTAKDRGRLDSEVRRQYEFLDGLLGRAKGGGLTGPRLVAQARLYGAAVWGSAQEVARGRMADDGYTHERSLLSVCEHCADCIDRAEQGWQPIGSLPRIGDSACRARCQCAFIYKRDPAMAGVGE